MLKLLPATAFLLLLMNNIFCQDKINADRPDQTESATLTPPHYFQAEFGFGKINNTKEDYELLNPTALFKYGLTKNFELRLEDDIETEYEQLIPQPKTTTGIKPVELGFRTALFEQKKIIPKTSLITQFAIPTLASDNFRAEHIAPDILLAFENDITKSIDAGYNFGAQWDGFSTEPQWVYSLSFGFDVSENVDAFAEVFGFARNSSQPQNNIDIGIGYYIGNNVKLDAYAGAGITKAAGDNFFGVGISFRIK